MKKSRFSEEKIISILRGADEDGNVATTWSGGENLLADMTFTTQGVRLGEAGAAEVSICRAAAEGEGQRACDPLSTRCSLQVLSHRCH
ncbi:MAG: hypothetical protein ABIT61_13520 [Steroidobacteraceae bacterium]